MRFIMGALPVQRMLSVIIPTCNRAAMLVDCLNMLSPMFQTLAIMHYEVIVSDDSKDDITQNLIVENFKWVRWVAGPKRGPAANRNNGARYATNEWLVFIDDDCLPNEELLAQYKQAIIVDKSVRVFEGSILIECPKTSFDQEAPINETGGYLWSCNFMIEKDLFFNSLSGFDEKFPYPAMEDVDLHYRLQKLNIQPKFLKTASVVHPWRVKKNITNTAINKFKSTLYFLDKHPEKKKNINSEYYLRCFYKGFIKDNIQDGVEFKFKGIFSKIIEDFMNLYFAIYLIGR